MADDPEYLSKGQDNELSPDRFVEKTQGEEEFPEGGAKAWGVALGCGGILFCTFGFANSFGYDNYDHHRFRVIVTVRQCLPGVLSKTPTCQLRS